MRFRFCLAPLELGGSPVVYDDCPACPIGFRSLGERGLCRREVGIFLVYPTTGQLLRELDEPTPGLGFIRYKERLVNAGFNYIHYVPDSPDVPQRFDQLLIPIEPGREISDRTTRMTRRAEKSKQIVKTEGDNQPSI